MGESLEKRQPGALDLQILRSRWRFLEKGVQDLPALGWQGRADPLDQFLLVLAHDVKDQLRQRSTGGNLDLVVGEEDNRFLEESLRSDLGADQGMQMGCHAPLGVFIEGAGAEVF